MKKIIKIINETISSNEFNFLGIDEINQNEDTKKILNSYDYQKTFLYDLLFNKKNIEIKTSEATIKKRDVETDRGMFDINYSTEVVHYFNEQLFEINVDFHGENVNYILKTNEYDGQRKLFIDWDSIGFTIFNGEGDIIDFNVFDKMDEKIERLFIKEFIGFFIETDILG